ncbi:MAG: RHS repeat-associated core domain-containing protein [Chloroflexi bacterium]|uniref:RHS repeat-associated core domain-containing protein n=1 Tax=Candidatus Chlorohelix allophototropha TaxID=3003348 RepID=A0A8T7M984_9CHLR|nr:RHS repeat-associated core domain-containing protein [Chloroflexota bacterium]WJW68621.1 RHS repeat-associated core domain-containing protein [Chloroflexota bacterium L227-S17]
MSLATDSSGQVASQQEFDPWGKVRLGSISQTTMNYTGQRLDGTGLLFYNTRYYDPQVGKFVSSDSIVPNPANPQAFNKYGYAYDNPLIHTDPTGHCGDFLDCLATGAAGFVEGFMASGGNPLAGVGAAAVELTFSAVNDGFFNDSPDILHTVAGAASPIINEALKAGRGANSGGGGSETQNDVANGPTTLYHSMRMDSNGKPALGDTARTLGARLGSDINEDSDNFVQPNTGGVSVSPEDPNNLPSFRRPPEFGGTGKDPVWKISSDKLGDNLLYRQDPDNSQHGFIEPSKKMSFEQYQESIWNTQDSWELVNP